MRSDMVPDWDLSTPGLRDAWDAGQLSPFHGWDKHPKAWLGPMMAPRCRLRAKVLGGRTDRSGERAYVAPAKGRPPR